jgi:signal transduction histidine kinase
MSADPTTTRLPTSPLARLATLGRRSGAPVADGPAAAVRADTVDAPRAPTGVPDVAGLVGVLERRGHVVRLTDLTAPGEVPDRAAGLVQLVLQDVVSALGRSAATDLNVTVRLRTDGGTLVLSVQTSRPVGAPRLAPPEARDEAALRRRVEGAGGRATLRATADGTWMAGARLPL